MDNRKIVVVGGGVLGSQIAFQAAYCGFDVTVWLRSEASVGRAKPKIDALRKTYTETIEQMDPALPETWARGIADTDSFSKEDCLSKTEAAYSSLRLETDLAAAVRDAYLVVESMAEIEKEKTEFYKKLAPLLPEQTILVTNSSTMLPSTFAKHTGRADRYLSLHFANAIWKNNTAEIMRQSETSDEAFEAVVQFANDIRMVALPVLKEKSGYLLNSLLVPFLLSGMDLLANGVSDPETIDRAWTLGTGAPRGPFQIIDVVGLRTTCNIVEQYQKVPGLFSGLFRKMMLPYNYRGMLEILRRYIAEGKLGKASGEGFYKY